MSEVDGWLKEIFDGSPVSPTEEQIASVITAQASPTEQIAIIRGALESESLVELFGELWDELCPGRAGLDPRTTLGHLLSLAKARESDIDFGILVREPNLPTWLKDELTALQGWRARQRLRSIRRKSDPVKDGPRDD